MQEIFRFTRTGFDADGHVIGGSHQVASGRACWKRLDELGLEVPPEIASIFPDPAGARALERDQPATVGHRRLHHLRYRWPLRCGPGGQGEASTSAVDRLAAHLPAGFDSR